MDKLKAVLKSRKFYAGVVLVLTAAGVVSDSFPVGAVTNLVCAAVGGCTP